MPEEPVAATAPVMPTPEPVVAAAPVAAPVYEAPKVVAAPPESIATPQPQPVAAPAPAPLKLEWPSDLQQVETSKERLQAAAQASSDDSAPKRVKRVRPPAEPVNSEPLQQVETRN